MSKEHIEWCDSPLFLLQAIFGPSRGPQHTGTALPRDTVVLLVIVPDAWVGLGVYLAFGQVLVTNCPTLWKPSWTQLSGTIPYFRAIFSHRSSRRSKLRQSHTLNLESELQAEKLHSCRISQTRLLIRLCQQEDLSKTLSPVLQAFFQSVVTICYVNSDWCFCSCHDPGLKADPILHS